MNQATLPFLPRKLSHAEMAEAWMDNHPEALELFRRFAEQMRQAGRRFGIGALTERVRWEYAAVLSPRDETFSINNNYRAWIARRLIEDDPRLAELIELRAAGGP